ncbi:hypothetical protein LT493_20660 [Streptomyces tricolor]|nr:hypothetical protein [Streptomyces tricolor]
MKLHRDELTPQMQEYARFDDRGEARYLPYLMYFHRADYRSSVINTDRAGFRISHGPTGRRRPRPGAVPAGPVRLISGSSTVLGIGATSDATTLASQLWRKHAPSAPWLNFGGRCYNSTQELLLFTLYRHLLPEIEEIVVFSGLNDLTVGRLPEWQQGRPRRVLVLRRVLRRDGGAAGEQPQGRGRQQAPGPPRRAPPHHLHPRRRPPRHPGRHRLRRRADAAPPGQLAAAGRTVGPADVRAAADGAVDAGPARAAGAAAVSTRSTASPSWAPGRRCTATSPARRSPAPSPTSSRPVARSSASATST